MILAPDVLFLDEPTTGLDPRGRLEVRDAVRALAAGGTTVLLTTHYLDEADRLSDRIALVDRGRNVTEDTPAGLKRAVGGDRVEVVLADPADLPVARAVVARVADGAASSDHRRSPPGGDGPMTTTATTPTASTATTAPRPFASAPIAPDDDGPRARVRWAVLDCLTMGRRDFTHLVRQPTLLLWQLGFPIVSVLLFVFVFGSAMQVGEGIDFKQFALPGLFAMTMAFGFMNTAVAVVVDRDRGITDRFRSMPMAPSAVVTGRGLADIVHAAFDLVIIALIALAVGRRTDAGPSPCWQLSACCCGCGSRSSGSASSSGRSPRTTRPPATSSPWPSPSEWSPASSPRPTSCRTSSAPSRCGTPSRPQRPPSGSSSATPCPTVGAGWSPTRC